MVSFKGHIIHINHLASEEFRREIAKEMGKEVKRFVMLRFKSKTGPRGHRWKHRTRHYEHPILDETGEMKRGWSSAPVRVTAKGFSISNRAGGGKAKYHQTGTERMPARRVYPIDGTTPKVVHAEFKRIIKRAQKRQMSK